MPSVRVSACRARTERPTPLAVELSPEVGFRSISKVGGERLGSPRKGPTRGAKCPHERRSDARGRELWSGGAARWRSCGALSCCATSKAVAFELDAMSFVDDAVEDGIVEGWVTDDLVV